MRPVKALNSWMNTFQRAKSVAQIVGNFREKYRWTFRRGSGALGGRAEALQLLAEFVPPAGLRDCNTRFLLSP